MCVCVFCQRRTAASTAVKYFMRSIVSYINGHSTPHFDCQQFRGCRYLISADMILNKFRKYFESWLVQTLYMWFGFKSLTVALGYSASCAGGAFVFDELTGVATWEGHWAKLLRIKKLIEVDTKVWSGESYKTTCIAALLPVAMLVARCLLTGDKNTYMYTRAI